VVGVLLLGEMADNWIQWKLKHTPGARVMQVTINQTRLGKPARIFTEDLVEDNSVRVKTFVIMPVGLSQQFSQYWQREGLLRPDQWVYSITKYYFYSEDFAVMEFRDKAHTLLGYYCDITTPVQAIGNEYSFTDLVLDLWVTPSLGIRELDQDEFDEAVKAGLMSADLQQIAQRTFERLKAEIAEGTFPAAYLK
jgi:predicted RNA-binding protein associated with RNAse of E/G family